jgi:cobalt-zinc-cadmium efflux system outer membrane protein
VAQVVLTESEVVRRAHEHAPEAGVARAAEALADARAQSAGRFPNPVVGWSRETIRTGQPSSQDIALATVDIDVARPLAERSLAAAEASWVHAEASQARTDVALQALLAFYEVVLAERRVLLRADIVADLEEATRVLSRREAVGSESGYATARLLVATELARSAHAEAVAVLESTRVVLAALVGLAPDEVVLESELSLSELDVEAALQVPAERDRAMLRHAQMAREHANEAVRRSRWAWVPTVQLGAGMKHVSDLGGGYGYVVGVALSLPLFDSGQSVRAEASAQRALADVRAEALTRQVLARMAEQYAIYRGARQELERFREGTAAQVATLLRAALSGYQRGELSLVELLDAQRARSEVADRELTLVGAVKRAEARVRAAAGELE